VGYPVEQRFKILQEQFQNAEQIAAPAFQLKPQIYPGVVIDYIARSDSGYCLKVIPFNPKVVTAAGELTFDDGSSNVPSDSATRFFAAVYPFDVAPTDVQSTFYVGQPVAYFPYWGTGAYLGAIRGTFICFGTASLPSGEIQFQSFQMGSNNQTVWDFARAHGMVE
jgi:hypothetical protein